jgi:hypothetical protein
VVGESVSGADVHGADVCAGRAERSVRGSSFTTTAGTSGGRTVAVVCSGRAGAVHAPGFMSVMTLCATVGKVMVVSLTGVRPSFYGLVSNPCRVWVGSDRG